MYRYFFLTLLIELPIIIIWLKKDWQQAIVIGFLLNLFTWPLLMFIVMHTKINVHLLEIAVAITEGIGYQLFFKRGWIISLIMGFLANGISYGIGLLL